ncbi:HAMP domain-containing sensor histidine kinase [Haloarculaceae archaeon H-GB11]|nr:HAMP domain-containing sensor histidine kinase [Haloarculaceae archaeon H-GB11]
MLLLRSSLLERELDADLGEHAKTMYDWSSDMGEFIERIGAVLEVLGDGDTIPLESVALGPVIGRLKDRFAETYPDVTFTFESESDAAVLADEMLVDVLGNLVRNAVTHNDAERPTIDVATESDGETVEIRIRDNGSGVPDRIKNAVFDQGQSGLHTDGVNHGFGLYFVRAKLTHYGGAVTVSDNEPRGAVFELTLADASNGR